MRVGNHQGGNGWVAGVSPLNTGIGTGGRTIPVDMERESGYSEVMGQPRRTADPKAHQLWNRQGARLSILEKKGNCAAIEQASAEDLDRPDVPKLPADCLTPEYWHLAVQAGSATEVPTRMQWVTATHAHCRHAHYHSTGEGPLYRGTLQELPRAGGSSFREPIRRGTFAACGAGRSDRGSPWASLWA